MITECDPMHQEATAVAADSTLITLHREGGGREPGDVRNSLISGLVGAYGT